MRGAERIGLVTAPPDRKGARGCAGKLAGAPPFAIRLAQPENRTLMFSESLSIISMKTEKLLKPLRTKIRVSSSSRRAKSIIIILLLALLSLVVYSLLLAPGPTPPPAPPVSNGTDGIGMPNPAAAYCKALGYQYKIIKTDDGGQIGVCVFPDGKECKAWDFFAGRCGREYTYCNKVGGKIITGRCPYANECAICLLPNGTKILEVELVGLSKIISGKGLALEPPYSSTLSASRKETDEKELPCCFDWRNVGGKDWTTPVKDQGSCGSCWAFSAVAVVESQYNIASGNPNLDFDLSEEYLVSNCSDAGTCCGGWHYKALSFIKDEGITDEMCFPYVDEDCYCSGFCLVEAVLYEAGVNNSDRILSTLRQFRDTCLKDEYVKLYYKYSPEMKEILLDDPSLLAEAAGLIQRYTPCLEYIMGKRGGDFQMKDEDIDRISSFLKKLEKKIEQRKERVGEYKSSEMISLLREFREQLEEFEGEDLRQAFRKSIYYESKSNRGENNCRSCGGEEYECYCTYSTSGACSDAKCSDRCPDWGGRLWKIDEWGSVSSDREEIKEKLIEEGPLSAAMGIGEDAGGYWDGEIYRCKNDAWINHAVVIVGYNETGEYWIVRNSWGEDWNGDGHFYVGYGECGIENYVYYAKVSAVPSVSISTDKYSYAANETMLLNVTFTNPTDTPKDMYFALSIVIPEYDWCRTVIGKSFTLPPGSKTYVLRWRLPNICTSFKARWHASLYDKTLKLLSEDCAEWRYDATAGAES